MSYLKVHGQGEVIRETLLLLGGEVVSLRSEREGGEDSFPPVSVPAPLPEKKRGSRPPSSIRVRRADRGGVGDPRWGPHAPRVGPTSWRVEQRGGAAGHEEGFSLLREF